MAYGAAARAAPPPPRPPPRLCWAGAAAAVLLGAACLVAALAVRAPTSLDAVLTAKMAPADVRVGWRDDHEEDEPAQQPGRSEPQAQPTALLAVETGKFSVRNTLSNMSDPSLDLDSYDDRTRLQDTQKRESESEKEKEKSEWRRIRNEKRGHKRLFEGGYVARRKSEYANDPTLTEEGTSPSGFGLPSLLVIGDSITGGCCCSTPGGSYITGVANQLKGKYKVSVTAGAGKQTNPPNSYYSPLVHLLVLAAAARAAAAAASAAASCCCRRPQQKTLLCMFSYITCIYDNILKI